MRDPVDIIQISLIDTWAATASGAFVLTENSLYTLEAWTNFLNRLTPRGVLSVSRWYYADRPGRGLPQRRAGGDDAAEDGREAPGRSLRHRAGPADADQGRARRHRHDPGVARAVLRRPTSTRSTRSPRGCSSKSCRARASRATRRSPPSPTAERLPALLEDYPLDISAPTDDSPFFFHMLRMRDVFNLQRWRDQGIVSFNMKAVGVLGVLLATVTLMTAACILLPLVRDPAAPSTFAARRPSSRLLRRDRLRLHARGDLTAAAADDLPRPSGLQPVGRPVLAARVERRRQPVHRARRGRRGGPARRDNGC